MNNWKCMSIDKQVGLPSISKIKFKKWGIDQSITLGRMIHECTSGDQ